MTQTIIIDDEAPSRTLLRQMLEKYCPNTWPVGEADSVASGISLIRKKKPEVVFLDIQMKDGTGFDLLQQFPHPSFSIIFTTAYDDFALKAFDFNTIDYLVKPISPKGLCRAISKVQNRYRHLMQAERLERLLKITQTKEVENIALSTSEGLVYLRLKELLRLKASGSYTTFYTNNGERVMVARTLKEFQQLLETVEGFFRPHQSHIINLSYVRKVLKEDGGYALMEDGVKVPVSRRKKEELLRLLEIRSLV